MSKTVTYQCNHCSREFKNANEILEISSNNNSLAIINNAKGARLKTLSLYSDLHFCSQDCMNNYLFLPLNSKQVIIKELERLKDFFAKFSEVQYSNRLFDEVIEFLSKNDCSGLE